MEPGGKLGRGVGGRWAGLKGARVGEAGRGWVRAGGRGVGSETTESGSSGGVEEESKREEGRATSKEVGSGVGALERKDATSDLLLVFQPTHSPTEGSSEAAEGIEGVDAVCSSTTHGRALAVSSLRLERSSLNCVGAEAALARDTRVALASQSLDTAEWVEWVDWVDWVDSVQVEAAEETQEERVGVTSPLSARRARSSHIFCSAS